MLPSTPPINKVWTFQITYFSILPIFEGFWPMKTLIMVVILVLSSFVHATPQDGNFYFKACFSPDSESQSICSSYTNGFIDAIKFQSAATSSVSFICPSPNVTSSQVKDLFKKYLVSHPQKRNIEARTLMGAALLDAFPCAAKRRN